MPTYDYRCRECGREFEVFQRMSDAPGASCPDCGRGAERLISGGAGFLFKGDGFYITDHRSEEYRKKAREESGAGTEKKGDGGAGANDAGGSAGDGAGSGGTKKDAGGDEVSAGSRAAPGRSSAGGRGD